MMSTSLVNLVESLQQAQRQAYDLFDQIESQKLLLPGVSEIELSQQIHEMAQAEFGLNTYWHKRLVRSGENTLCVFDDNPPDRVIGEDEILFIDLGPVFGDYEADFGKTYVLGSDSRKLAAKETVERLFHQCKAFYQEHPHTTGAALYQYAVQAGSALGWDWGSEIAGHLIGVFPHKKNLRVEKPQSMIWPLNTQPLAKMDASGNPCHWILEIHIVDKTSQIGAFYEDFLTLNCKPLHKTNGTS